MIRLIKLLYRWKIRIFFYFNLGFGEVANVVSAVKDVAILLAFAVFSLKIQLGFMTSLFICIGSLIGFTLLGFILKRSGMSDFATKTTNSVNPELKKINQIAEKLGIKE